MSTTNTRHLAPLALMGSLTPESVGRLIEFHRATFGDARMDAATPPERPEGVSDEEWSALGDPGKSALVRERERAANAERELAAARAAAAARPTPPAQQQTQQSAGQAGTAAPGGGEGDDAPKGKENEPDLSTLIQQAVTAAVTPLQQRLDGWEAGHAAQKVTSAVTEAAGGQFYDTTDVLAQIDLASLTDGQGGPDQTKITAALEKLAQDKPHLVKPFDDRRRVAPGAPIGATGPAAVSIDDQVKARLAKMQQSTGVKLAAPAS